jgi:hypothetical protein
MKNSLQLEIKSVFVGGHLLSSVANDDYSYYGIFNKFLISRDDSEYKKHILNDPSTYAITPSALDSTKFKASIILNMKKYGVDYGQSYQISSEGNDYLSLSVDSAIDVVLSNYLYMLDSKKCWPGTVFVDDNGHFCIQEGVHRQIINMVNGFDSSNFFVTSRSPEWLNFISSMREEGRTMYGGENVLYNKIFHPDFDDFSVIREDRASAIYECVKDRGINSVVDLGAQVGTQGFYLGIRGFRVAFIEYEQKYVAVLKRLCKTYGVDASVFAEDIVLFDLNKVRDYDLMVMTSIFYHLLRNDSDLAMAFIDRVKSIFKFIVIDDEPRTGILPADTLIQIMQGFSPVKILTGADDRNLYLFIKD